MVGSSGRTGSGSSSIASLFPPAGSDEAQVLLSQDEYGCQLQLALERSQLDPQGEHTLLGTGPRPAAEALSFKYWATQGLTTEDILVNGFYELSGDFAEAGPAQDFPSLETLHSVVPHSEGEPAREVILLNLRVDPRLREIVQSAKAAVEDVSDLGVAARYQALARVVARAMGGPVASKPAAQQEWLAAVSAIKQESQSLVIPIGRLAVGLSRHRALLFKFLADLCEMECRVLKGRYLAGGLEEGCAILRYLGEERFIDLMFSPGMTHPLVRDLDQGSAPNLLASPLAPSLPGMRRSSEQGSGSGSNSGSAQCTPPLTPRHRQRHQHQQQLLLDGNYGAGLQSSGGLDAWEQQRWLGAAGEKPDALGLGADAQRDAHEEYQQPPEQGQQQAEPCGMVKSRSYHDYMAALVASALASDSRHMQRSDTWPPSSQLHAAASDADLAGSTLVGRCPVAQAGLVHHAQSMPEMAAAAAARSCSGRGAPALHHTATPPIHVLRADSEPWEASSQAQEPLAPEAFCPPQGEAGPFSFGGPGPNSAASMQCASPKKLGELFLTSPFGRTCAYEDGEPASPDSALVARQSSLASRASTGSLQALRHTDSLSSTTSGLISPSFEASSTISSPLLSTATSFSTTATQSMRLPSGWLQPLAQGQPPALEGGGGDGVSNHHTAAGVVEGGTDEWEIAPEEILVGPRIGIGSYGEVYRGSWRHTCVAIKRLLDQELNEEVLSAFKSEVSIMKRLRHPNILQFIGACTSPPSLCIVSPFCARGTLFRLLHRTPGFNPDERRRIQMALDVARGMNYLHSCKPPIVHRDLKSPNLLVDKDWTVKVCDFGLSRVRSSTWLSSRSQAGTPEWTAPEVLKSQDSNEKSDVYSFGVILWELLTGQEPWKDRTAIQVVGCVGWNDERLPIPDTMKPEYRALIARCFAQQGERPSFSEILPELKGWLHALRPPQPPRLQQVQQEQQQQQQQQHCALDLKRP